jgi:hypothetical protein
MYTILNLWRIFSKCTIYLGKNGYYFVYKKNYVSASKIFEGLGGKLLTGPKK